MRPEEILEVFWRTRWPEAIPSKDSPEQTVRVKEYKVRAHFRRNKNHLNGDPALRNLVQGFFEKHFGQKLTTPTSPPKKRAAQ